MSSCSHRKPAPGVGPPAWDLGRIFRTFGTRYRQTHTLSREQRKVMRAIEACRTAKLGGHIQRCDHCRYEMPVYNSCQNRHCPKCQTVARERWLKAREGDLLPVPYFHNVFTLPHELNPLVHYNMDTLLTLLFRATADTLKDFGSNDLGGQVGFTAILHTWDQKLNAHFHLHCLIPAGALAKDPKRWNKPPNAKYLFPVKGLAKMFRGKFLDTFKVLLAGGKLTLPPSHQHLDDRSRQCRFIDALYHKDWVVYSKRPMAGPEQVLAYLARYTHRVAIANSRIVDVADKQVFFGYRDRRAGNRQKQMALSVEEFTRRFLLHVLPDGFMRIRHFGWLANRDRKQNIRICRELLGVTAEPNKDESLSAEELLLGSVGIDITRCPRCCKGRMVRVAIIVKQKCDVNIRAP